jgi:hypothetical protein
MQEQGKPDVEGTGACERARFTADQAEVKDNAADLTSNEYRIVGRPLAAVSEP